MDPHAFTPKIQPSHNCRHCNFASFSLHKLSTQRNAPSQYFLSQKKKKKGPVDNPRSHCHAHDNLQERVLSNILFSPQTFLLLLTLSFLLPYMHILSHLSQRNQIRLLSKFLSSPQQPIQYFLSRSPVFSSEELFHENPKELLIDPYRSL